MYDLNISSNTTHRVKAEKTLKWKIQFGVSILIFVVSFFGNVMVLLIVNGTKTKRRRTPYELFIANLSISDLVFVFSYLFIMYFEIPRSLFFCAALHPVMSVTMGASIFTLTSMAGYRCRIILYPFRRKPTWRAVRVTLLCLWLLAIVCMIPVFAVTKPSPDGDSCNEVWPLEILNKAYTIALCLIQYVLPLNIIIFSYANIILYLKRHRLNQRTHRMSITGQEDNDVRRAFIVIVLLYAILNLPGQIAWILHVVLGFKESAKVWFTFSDICLVAHSCANPFVYGLITQRFRKGFVHYLSRLFCCCRWRTFDLTHKEQDKKNKAGRARQDMESCEKPDLYHTVSSPETYFIGTRKTQTERC